MSMTPTLSPTPAKKAKAPTEKPKAKKKGGKPDGASAPTQLDDTFTRQTQQAQERHLRKERLAQLQAQEQLHKAKIQAMFAQLQTQLFSIWNDIWMQRRKAHDEAFKSWLKLLSA